MAGAGPDNNVVAAARSLEDRVWRMLRDDNSQGALAACRQLNREFPRYAPGWRTASRLALQFGNPRAALAASERALALEPESTEGLLQRALCLGRLGQNSRTPRAGRPTGDPRIHDGIPVLRPRDPYTPAGATQAGSGLLPAQAALEPHRGKHCFNSLPWSDRSVTSRAPRQISTGRSNSIRRISRPSRFGQSFVPRHRKTTT